MLILRPIYRVETIAYLYFILVFKDFLFTFSLVISHINFVDLSVDVLQ